jgi:membrane protein required for colicin V production
VLARWDKNVVTVLDVVTLGAIAGCAAFGAMSGLVSELSHIGALFCGFIAAEYFHDFLAENVFYRIGGTGAEVVAYIVIFVAVAAPIFIAAHYLKNAIDSTKLKIADQIGGCLFGAVQGAIIVAVTLSVLVYFTGTVSSDYVQKSRVSAYVMKRTGAFVSFIPKRCYEKTCTFLAEEGPHAVEELSDLKRKMRGNKNSEAYKPHQAETAPEPSTDAPQQK